MVDQEPEVLRPAPKDINEALSDINPAPGDTNPTSGDGNPAPGDTNPAPSDGNPAPGDGYPAPGEINPVPGDINVLVKFFTKQEQYSVPGSSVSVKSNIDSAGLNKVIRAFRGEDEELPEFDFIVEGELLIGELQSRLEEAYKSLESLVEVEFLEKQPPPTPKDSLQHDDWVAAVAACQDWLLTGCYDNTLHLWAMAGLAAGQGRQAHTLTIPAHKAPVKAVAWVHTDTPTKTFISASIDQGAQLWAWHSETNSVECVCVCRGHTQSVECVAVSPSRKVFATGSWDNTLNIWSADLGDVRVDYEDEDRQDRKKRRTPDPNKLKKKIPIKTLTGHSESVGGVAWTREQELATASWDHSVRLWDLEIGGVKSQFIGNCAFFSISWSPLNSTLLTGCADRYIRVYDPRTTSGSVVKQKYTSHTKWIPSVKWSSTKEHQFVSGGYDNLVKMWDVRSPKAPLYDMTGHRDKVLAVDWSNPDFIVSGSADCTAKVYATDGKP